MIPQPSEESAVAALCLEKASINPARHVEKPHCQALSRLPACLAGRSIEMLFLYRTELN